MSIVQTAFRRHKLRQERHGLKHRNYRSRRSLPAKHAAYVKLNISDMANSFGVVTFTR